MNIKKPYKFIPYKKYPDKYFDWETHEEFPKSKINEHPLWYKKEYNQWGNQIYYEQDDGYWSKSEYDEAGKKLYWENSSGEWQKWIYDNNGNLMYYESCHGVIIDHRI